MEKRHSNADSSALELLMRSILVVNQPTIYHVVSVVYNRVQKMHQVELDFDHYSLVDDVTTMVHHGTRKEVTGEVSKRLAGFLVTVSVGGTNICDETVHVIGKCEYHNSLQRRESEYKRRKRKQTKRDNKDNTAIRPARLMYK